MKPVVEKLDLKKKYAGLYKPSTKKVEVVAVPPLQFAMIDGAVEPGYGPSSSPAFQKAVEALYGISYTLKFMSKLDKENPLDYSVMALEGLWWVENELFDINKPDNWKFTLMIMQPDHISLDQFNTGLEQLRKKRGDKPAINRLRLENFQEGLSMQIMHLGPYADEPATIAKMDTFASENGYQQVGKHHEIYMSDPRRGKPETTKTILRHPITKG